MSTLRAGHPQGKPNGPDEQPEGASPPSDGCPFDVTGHAATVERSELNELAWRIKQEWFCYERTPSETDVIDMCLLRSYAKGISVATIPNPVKENIADFIGRPSQQNFKEALDDLQTDQIIRVIQHEKGWDVVVNAPPWPKRTRKIKAELRRAFLRRFQESIGHVPLELPGVIVECTARRTSEAHNKSGEARPSINPTAEFQQSKLAIAEIQQSTPPAGEAPIAEIQQNPVTSEADEAGSIAEFQQCPPPLKDFKSLRGLKLCTSEEALKTLRALKAKPDQELARLVASLDPDAKRDFCASLPWTQNMGPLRERVHAYLDEKTWANWIGRWTNSIKLDRDAIQRMLADRHSMTPAEEAKTRIEGGRLFDQVRRFSRLLRLWYPKPPKDTE